MSSAWFAIAAWATLGVSLVSLILIARGSTHFLHDLATILVPTLEGVVLGALLGYAVNRTDPGASPAFFMAVGVLIGLGVGCKRYLRNESPIRHPRGFWIVVAFLTLPLVMDACGEAFGPWFCGLQGC